jgi:AraC-like DNA-binding protein
MRLLSYIPSWPLSDFVDLLWLCEGEAPAHARERVLPTGTVEMVIPLQDDSGGPLICGPYSEFFVIETAQKASIMGVHFKPGGAFPFLPLPAGELHNANVALDTFWGTHACQLHDRLREARTPAARFRILEQSLLARAARPLARHPAFAFALKEFQDVRQPHTVAEVTKHLGFSPRRFIQTFTDEVGLTPKLFCRIHRFQEVLRLIDKNQRFDWANVALACGYYDQAHFIHDFRAFSGLNPTTYLRDRGEHFNHVPLAD